MSFRKTVPVFAYVRSVSVVLSVHADKTDEEELQTVVDKARTLLGESSAVEISDYTSATDVSLPGRYIIFWELVYSSNLDRDILQKCANKLDAGFNHVYQKLRSMAFIGPLELRIVREGTFAKMMNAAVTRGAATTQYKPAGCVCHPLGMEVLNEGTVGAFRSTATPEFLT